MTHTRDCNWSKADCKYVETHEYCPHPEHACNCDGPKNLNCVILPPEVTQNPESEHREKLAKFMIRMNLATGHGDTFDELLKALEAEIKSLEESSRVSSIKRSVEEIRILKAENQRLINTISDLYEKSEDL